MNKDKLLELRDQIDQAKEQINQLEGRKKYLMQQLSDQWGCQTVKEAKKKLENLESEVVDLDSKIKQGIQSLEEEYDLD